MPSPRQQFGAWAEDAASQFLRQKGYEVLDRHVTSRHGEIDLVAKDHDTIVFVEVKARRNQSFGQAAESVTKTKLKRLRLAIEDYLSKMQWQDREVRIDLVTVEQKKDGAHKVSHLQGISL
ncbi:MAG: YraN family protein [Candidatus Kerfeldbacteria bacterium]|nr:YraN family protein [Candidatus Kerfeldbacteria bacterium]